MRELTKRQLTVIVISPYEAQTNKIQKEQQMKKTFSYMLMTVLSTAVFAQTKVILDTDIGSDCDDAGAMAVLHKLADKGEVKILGVIYSSGKNKFGIGVCDAINTYYGRGDLPLGQNIKDDLSLCKNSRAQDRHQHIRKYLFHVLLLLNVVDPCPICQRKTMKCVS